MTPVPTELATGTTYHCPNPSCRQLHRVGGAEEEGCLGNLEFARCQKHDFWYRHLERFECPLCKVERRKNEGVELDFCFRHNHIYYPDTKSNQGRKNHDDFLCKACRRGSSDIYCAACAWVVSQGHTSESRLRAHLGIKHPAALRVWEFIHARDLADFLLPFSSIAQFNDYREGINPMGTSLENNIEKLERELELKQFELDFKKQFPEEPDWDAEGEPFIIVVAGERRDIAYKVSLEKVWRVCVGRMRRGNSTLWYVMDCNGRVIACDMSWDQLTADHFWFGGDYHHDIWVPTEWGIWASTLPEETENSN